MSKRSSAGCWLVICACSIALADPATAPDHSEKEYRAIGGGLYIRQDENLTPYDGNIAVSILSTKGIDLERDYTIDVSVAFMDGPGELSIDAGSLGDLRVQIASIDCVHQTFAVFRKHSLYPRPTWRDAATLPALAPVFQYVCTRTPEKRRAALKSSAERGPLPREVSVAPKFPLTDPALNEITKRDPSAARKIMSVCRQSPGKDANGTLENHCRADEIGAWNRLSASGGIETAAASGCPSPPFPNTFVGEETCLEHAAAGR